MSRKSYQSSGKKLQSRSRHEKIITKNKPHYILIVKGKGDHKIKNLIPSKGSFNEYLPQGKVGDIVLRKHGEKYPFSEIELAQIAAKPGKVHY